MIFYYLKYQTYKLLINLYDLLLEFKFFHFYNELELFYFFSFVETLNLLNDSAYFLNNHLFFFNFTYSLEFLKLLIIFFISLIFSSIIFFLSYFIIYQENDVEKISAYECGFQPFEDARNKFDIRFYLVAILFIIFDLEIMFLFPWILGLQESIDFIHFYSMIFFLFILTIGFFYEWKKKALDW